MQKTTYHQTYDSAKARYLKVKAAGFKVVLRRPIGEYKTYRVKVL